MKPILSPTDYCAVSVFEAEQKTIFRSAWQFAGLVTQLSYHQDYLALNINRQPVILYNFQGELRAFLNVCSHRFSRIRTDGKGHGPLQCQYHGWTYNIDGLPTGITNFPYFEDFKEERRCELALERWQVETCGKLIFVCPGLPHASLREHLGDAWENMQSMGEAFGEEVSCTKMTIRANWKVVLENTLESYHVRFVHPATFARLEAKTQKYCYAGFNSSWYAAIKPSIGDGLAKLAKTLKLSYSPDGYFHQFVFPTLTLATTYGVSFSLQTIEPLDVETTAFTTRVFTANIDEASSLKQNQLRSLAAMATDFNSQVFEEDKTICEEVQLGTAHASPMRSGELSSEEQRVLAFQQAYAESMRTRTTV
jgi:phenylpropionate dioxygenase-like ring-hydroxylating dioxygenase large terminal subunit